MSDGPEQELTWKRVILQGNLRRIFFMPSTQKRIILSFVSGILFIGIIAAMFLFSSGSQPPVHSTNSSVQQGSETSQDSFTYQGRDGVDALTLLEEQTEVKKAPSGFVIAINGREADEGKKEFWAFYVNGEQAQVGAADYETKDTDQIEWRIETY